MLDPAEAVSNIVLVWDTLYLDSAAGGLAADPVKTPSRKPGFKSRNATPALTVLLTDAALMWLQRSFEAADQGGSSERLGQEANGARLQRAGSDALFRKGRDKDKRRGIPMGPHMGQKVQAAHSGHLHIGNDT